MTITSTPRWSLGRGNAVVPSRWQATEKPSPPAGVLNITTGWTYNRACGSPAHGSPTPFTADIRFSPASTYSVWV